MELRSHTYVLFLMGLLSAPLCFAAGDDDEDDRMSAYDFAEKFAGEDKAVLNSALQDLKEQEKKYKEKPNREKVREIDEDLAKLKTEADFLNLAKAHFSSRTRVEDALKSFDPSKVTADETLIITSVGRTVAEAKAAQGRVEAEIKKTAGDEKWQNYKKLVSGDAIAGLTDDARKAQREAFEKDHQANIAKLDDIEKELKTAPSGAVVLASDPKSPFQLVASTKFDSNSKTTTMSVRVQLKPNAQELMTGDARFKRMIEKAGFDDLKASVDANLSLKNIDLGKDPAKVVENAKSSRTSTAVMGNVKDKVDERVEKIGSKGDSTSEIGAKEEERAAMTDTKKKAEALLNVQLQKKITEWIKQNKGTDMSPCQILSKVMDDNKSGLLEDAEWIKIPQDSRQKCAELDPNKRREAAFSAGKEASEGESAEEQRRALAARAYYDDLAAKCEEIRKNAMSAATENITGPIQKMKDGLDRAGLSSELFVRMITNDEGEIDLDDPSNIQLESMVQTAASVVSTVTKDKSGNDRLLREREAVSNLVRRGWLALERSGSLQQLVQPGTGFDATGKPIPVPTDPMGQMLIPQKINLANDQVQKMAHAFNAAKTLLNAIDAEIAGRDAANKAKFSGGAQGAAPGTVQVNDVSSNSGDPRRATGGGRTADRIRIQNNQKAKGSRPAGNGPNYLNR
jgi:hypothetical protein